ncbi:MAG: NifU family protein [Phycisphaerales bacterium]|jgi:Fe-S cluster biogenesis protein NfuA|nr:NifU family protein [Phycisphaerales bacterium]
MGCEPTQSPLHTRVLEVLELIRPSIQADGGDIELVEVSEDGVVSIRFLGACIGCPSSDMTLQQGIEKTLKEHIEAIKSVLAVS